MFIVIGSFPLQIEGETRFEYKTFCEYYMAKYRFDIDVETLKKLEREIDQVINLKARIALRVHDKVLNLYFDEKDSTLVSTILNDNTEILDEIFRKYYTHEVYLVKDIRPSIINELVDLETTNPQIQTSGLGSNTVHVIMNRSIDSNLKSFLILKYNLELLPSK